MKNRQVFAGFSWIETGKESYYEEESNRNPGAC